MGPTDTERARMRAAETCVSAVVTVPLEPREVIRRAAERGQADRGEVMAAVWRLAGLHRLKITTAALVAPANWKYAA